MVPDVDELFDHFVANKPSINDKQFAVNVCINLFVYNWEI